MKKRDAHNWTFEGKSYTVGESLTKPLSPSIYRHHNGRLIVWYRKKLYLLGHSRGPTRCCIHDFFTGSMYWTRLENVFQILQS